MQNWLSELPEPELAEPELAEPYQQNVDTLEHDKPMKN